MEFEESQNFKVWWALALIIGLNGLFLYAIVQQLFLGKPFGTKPAPDAVLVGIEVLMLALLIGFRSLRLKTLYNAEGIRYRFIPFHRYDKQIAWTDLNNAYMRPYNSLLEYGGWGIRIGTFKNGRAINTTASGKTGLQLEFNDGKRLLIGTAKPAEVEKIIDLYFKKHVR